LNYLIVHVRIYNRFDHFFVCERGHKHAIASIHIKSVHPTEHTRADHRDRDIPEGDGLLKLQTTSKLSSPHAVRSAARGTLATSQPRAIPLHRIDA
jgi:hypothetical protein